MSSAISRAEMANSIVRLSPRSIIPLQLRTGVNANASPSCGERTSSEPKYVRWRGGHFCVEIFTSTATSFCPLKAHLKEMISSFRENRNLLDAHHRQRQRDANSRQAIAGEVLRHRAAARHKLLLRFESQIKLSLRRRILAIAQNPFHVFTLQEFVKFGRPRIWFQKPDLDRIAVDERSLEIVRVRKCDQNFAAAGFAGKPFIHEFRRLKIRRPFPQIVLA